MSTNKLVTQFMNITGSDEKAAKHMLEACNNNIEMAVSMYLDNPSIPNAQNEPGSSNANAPSSDDNVRAPIPQTQGILVEEEYTTTNTYKWNKARPNTVFDGFRDFRAETKRQEELSSTSNKLDGTNKLKRLEDLFRPPLELVHRGTLQTARDAGKIEKKWLMVSVHNVKEFTCQVLNRDVWSNKMVQDIIKENFIFWQVYSDSNEGAQFTMFYPVIEWPHVTILDPRTGEQLAKWKDITSQSFIENVANFLAQHGTLEDDSNEPPSKRQKTDSLIDKSEDSQLKAAIEASLKEANEKKNDEFIISDSGSEFYSSSDEEKKAVDNKNDKSQKLNEIKNTNSPCHENGSLLNGNLSKSCEITNSSSDKKPANSSMVKIHPKPNKLSTENACNILIRLPDGNRNKIVLSKDNSIKILIKKVIEMGYSDDQYELITNFPRQNISLMDKNISLSNVGLYPRATVFVQEI